MEPEQTDLQHTVRKLPLKKESNKTGKKGRRNTFTVLKERYIFEEKAHNSAQRMKKIWITLRKVKEKTFSNQRRKKPERITHYNFAKIMSMKDERNGK